MAGDNLLDILSAIRADLSEIPDEQWEKFKRLLCTHAGGVRVYVPAHKKRNHFEVLAAAGDQATAEQLAKKLGVSVRHAQRLKRLL
jgi:hypothetical protein